MKGPFAAEPVDRESVYTLEIVTDQGGNLRIKQADGFTGSRVHLDFAHAAAEVRPTTSTANRLSPEAAGDGIWNPCMLF